MTTTACVLFWTLIPLFIVCTVICWALETDRERAQRWRKTGTSQAEIGRRLGLNRYRVRQLLA